MTAQLLGLSDIARRLGMSRQRMHRLAKTPRADFPRPAHELPTGRYWRESDIERWIAAHPHYDHSHDDEAAA